jgi:predicted ferric reductase
MIALTTPYLWYTTRATGMVALILFTLVASLGTLVANRIGGTIVGRFEINELHRSLSMVAVTFLVIHILTTVLDSYVATGWISAFVPMTSAYKRLAVGIGAVAFDLILAVWISSLLKLRIANTTWRFIHWFSWMGFATALVHGYMTGTDSRSGFGLVVVASCAAVVACAALWRFFGRPTRAAGRTALSPLATTKAATRATPVPPRATPPAPRPFPTSPARTTKQRGPR